MFSTWRVIGMHIILYSRNLRSCRHYHQGRRILECLSSLFSHLPQNHPRANMGYLCGGRENKHMERRTLGSRQVELQIRKMWNTQAIATASRTPATFKYFHTGLAPQSLRPRNQSGAPPSPSPLSRFRSPGFLSHVRRIKFPTKFRQLHLSIRSRIQDVTERDTTT